MRRLFNLITQLPAASALANATAPHGYFDRVEQLLSLLLEGQDTANRIQRQVWGKKGQRLGDPVRIEWPGRAEPAKQRKQPSSPEEIARFMGGSVKVIRPGGNGGA